jgi:hypothetical protein
MPAASPAVSSTMILHSDLRNMLAHGSLVSDRCRNKNEIHAAAFQPTLFFLHIHTFQRISAYLLDTAITLSLEILDRSKGESLL